MKAYFVFAVALAHDRVAAGARSRSADSAMSPRMTSSTSLSLLYAWKAMRSPLPRQEATMPRAARARIRAWVELCTPPKLAEPLANSNRCVFIVRYTYGTMQKRELPLR